jgi:hypothetical protein
MGKLKIPKYREKELRKIAQNRLHTAVQTAIIPYFQDNVRVDTGRLRESIRAEYPEFDSSGNRVETLIEFGGVSVDGVLKERGVSRDVDYVEELYTTLPADGELEDTANQLPDEIDYYLGSQKGKL